MEWVRYLQEAVIPFQAAQGMNVTASFVDDQDEDTNVWMRRFEDDSNSDALYEAVYQHDRWTNEIGPVVASLVIPGRTVVTRVSPTPASPLR
ncbi:NIPSNAP family containing protein [Nonomuraea terrae]|uniref:NIPSNAP family containing protein n=1 Tax=Nonomuraea terrae TaxID=2530383 RepID=A0A4R4Z2D1_9ACTN|nr:NIPSNAP family containing protein [Nonomuraea terrae]TDD52053.1 NIPSNAP family containing protein [Nonomuraea terrae]